MKIKPARDSGGVLLELRPGETELPGNEGHMPVLPVFKLKHILVPVDFSECSKKALQYAVSFAKQFGAELTLLHVVQNYPLAYEVPSLEIQAIEEAGRQVEALRLPAAEGVSSNSLLRNGTPHVEIVTVAKEIAADLIIISTHGRTGLAHVLMGSAAEKVVRHAGCPVLIVREQERDFVEQTSDY